jgi:hypothetical protein
VITNQKRRDNNHEKKTVPCAQTTTTTTTSNFEFTNALDRENYKTVTVHTNNTNEFSNVTNALQERERRQRRLRRQRRRSNLCGCNSGNNNNNRTRSVENAGCGCARWHGNVKELREQEGGTRGSLSRPKSGPLWRRGTRRRPLCPPPNPWSKNFVGVGNRNSTRVDVFSHAIAAVICMPVVNPT